MTSSGVTRVTGVHEYVRYRIGVYNTG